MSADTPLPHDPAALTQFLVDLRDGKAEATSSLMPVVYERLRSAAERYARTQGPGRSLEPTALAHEVYLKLFGNAAADWNDRVHFYALAARAMRQLLVDRARRRRLAPREDLELERLEDSFLGDTAQVDLIDLDAALEELAALDERESRVVELRFFGGLEMQQIADVLGVSKSSVERDWVTARAWLGRRLESGNP